MCSLSAVKCSWLFQYRGGRAARENTTDYTCTIGTIFRDSYNYELTTHKTQKKNNTF